MVDDKVTVEAAFVEIELVDQAGAAAGLHTQAKGHGYLTRGNTDRDKPTRILTLTPRGLEPVAAIREALELLETRTHDQLGRQRYRTLLNALADIQALPNSRSTQQIG